MQPPFPFPPHLPKRIGCALRCVRDLFAEQARRPPQILATVNDQYVLDLANVFFDGLEAAPASRHGFTYNCQRKCSVLRAIQSFQ
jgi:hypothetical protein